MKQLRKTGKFLLLGYFYYLSLPISAQTTFQKTFGGVLGDYGNSVQQTIDGGYIIAGTTQSFGAGARDIFLIKTDDKGDTLWLRTYGSSDFDEGYSVQQTSEGGYIILGNTTSNGGATNRYLLIKTDGLGNIIWTKTYASNYSANGKDVKQTSDGGYILFGSVRPILANGDNYMYLIRTDSVGDTLWAKSYGGSNRDEGFAGQQTSDGGFIMVGSTMSFGAGDADVSLIKINSNGDLLWEKIYGGVEEDVGRSVMQTTDGGYIIGGYTRSYGTGGVCSPILCADIYLIKTDDGGDTLWTRTYGTTGNDLAFSVKQTTDGGFILIGQTDGLTASRDVYLVKTDSLGGLQWTKTFGGTDDDYGNVIQQTIDRGYILSGTTKSEGAGWYDIYLIKIDSNGNGNCNQINTDAIVGNNVANINTATMITELGTTISAPALLVSNFPVLDSVLCSNCTAPTAAFESIVGGSLVNFSDSSLYASSWLWDFGDGSFDTVQNPSHTYLNNDIYNVCLYASNICDTDTICQTIIISGVGIQKGSWEDRFVIYPNPNMGQVTLDFQILDNVELSIMLYNVTSQLIYSGEFGNISGDYTHQMDMSKYSRGIYFLQVQTNDDLVRQKIILH